MAISCSAEPAISEAIALAQSSCISECRHKDTIIKYTFSAPLTLALIETLAAGWGSSHVDAGTGIFKIADLDHFYIFGRIGSKELRICMYSSDKMKYRLAIDKALISFFEPEGNNEEKKLNLMYNKTGSLARISVLNA